MTVSTRVSRQAHGAPVDEDLVEDGALIADKKRWGGLSQC